MPIPWGTSGPVTFRAHRSCGGARQIPRPETPVVPARPSRTVFRADAKIRVRPGRPLRYAVCPVRTRRRTDWTLGFAAYSIASKHQVKKGSWSEGVSATPNGYTLQMPRFQGMKYFSSYPEICCPKELHFLGKLPQPVCL